MRGLLLRISIHRSANDDSEIKSARTTRREREGKQRIVVGECRAEECAARNLIAITLAQAHGGTLRVRSHHLTQENNGSVE